MSKINVLKSEVYNRISAGEVVERPSSVVKELVENSLDAGATSISIHIEEGGIKLISIKDNGSGIEFDDLKKAFLPHATSKILVANDLDNIETLGFRGEALASIGAVSQTEIISKVQNCEYGGRIEDCGGEIGESEICGASNGTTINVRNLFLNTPARLKFLKTPKQEESLVTNIVSRLIFANPDVEIKYTIGDKTVFNSFGKGAKNKIFTIYGKETVNSLMFVDKQEKNCKLSGYLSLPNSCKANRTYQTLIVNGRYVSNALISTAISNAYSNFLMKGKFPLYILYLSIPYEDIDVNVHPSKMEVRFKDSKEIYNFVYYAVLETLQQNNFPVEYAEKLDEEETIKDKENESSIPQITSGGFSFGMMQKFASEMSSVTVDAPKYAKENIKNLSDNNGAYREYFSNKNYIEKNLSKTINNLKEENNSNPNIFFENTSLKLQPEIKIETEQQSINSDISFRIIGSLFNTYILVECADNFLMIDQHAGHERVLFDKFMKMYNEKKLFSQPLLVPYSFTVNEIEENLLIENKNVLHEMGFEIENFGHNTYRICSIPSILSNIDLHEFIMETLGDVNVISKTNEQIKNHFATCACKAAVKGGQDLDNSEISILLKQIFQNNTRLQCPHGRPICVKFTKNEVEKMFKRIVS